MDFSAIKGLICHPIYEMGSNWLDKLVLKRGPE